MARYTLLLIGLTLLAPGCQHRRAGYYGDAYWSNVSTGAPCSGPQCNAWQPYAPPGSHPHSGHPEATACGPNGACAWNGACHSGCGTTGPACQVPYGPSLDPRAETVGCGPRLYHCRLDNLISHCKACCQMRRRWREHCRTVRPSCHFREGFEQGYCDLAAGWSGVPPAVPPEPYWSQPFRTPEGHQAALDWYEGYRVGVTYAERDGYRAFNHVPLDPLAAASLAAIRPNAAPCGPGHMPLPAAPPTFAPGTQAPLVPQPYPQYPSPPPFHPTAPGYTGQPPAQLPPPTPLTPSVPGTYDPPPQSFERPALPTGPLSPISPARPAPNPGNSTPGIAPTAGQPSHLYAPYAVSGPANARR